MSDGEREPLAKRSISLAPSQWHWLEARSVRSQTRSAAAEIRRLVADAMRRDAAAPVEGAA